VKTVPWQAKPLSIEFATSTNTVNDLKWSQLTTYSETGGTLILNYKLRWNQGAAINTWVDLVTVPGSSTSYLHTTLLAGLYYEYTISAENIFGFGPASSIFTVRTSQVPDQPDPVVTSVYLTYIKVTWTAPFANYQ